jgi:hypothetical protein
LKLLSFDSHGEQRLGQLHDQGIIDLGRAHDLFLSEVTGRHGGPAAFFPQRMIDFLESGEELRSYTSDLTDHVLGLLPERSQHVSRAFSNDQSIVL